MFLVVAVDALDDAFGHAYKAFQLGGGALQGREVAEFIYCLTVRGMSLGRWGRKSNKTSVSLSSHILAVHYWSQNWTFACGGSDSKTNTLSILYLFGKPELSANREILGGNISMAAHVLGRG